ncbi:type IV toxin-antitoxin system AbiEi family antitoxin domain-containing protein [Agathobacter ruminis]|uniref:Transcriptional regulator n=1 Tax=Agathobacter ruminis TaxID=1712665 RepID=A0A2G3E3R3_9FIRM|nr:hypothetical protein [Agathobacter ruminis]MDC7302231.1 hypothetical protein [Agathobacter ruminis]PHU37937.1 hypothetical protein CSX02_05330 [Agathobacter ruminis]
MLLTYQECIDKFGSDYKIKKEIADGMLFMKEKGIYSTKRNSSEIDVIMLKYPKAVYTGRSAFYYHSLTDVIPDHYYLATRRTDTRIRDSRIRQSFVKDDIFEAGISQMQYNNSQIRIYNIERMLIELMRFKAKFPMDYYKEIIQNYRRLSFDMDFGLVEEYAAMFNNGARLMDMIQMEVL